MHWTEWILAYGPNTRLLARLSWDIIKEHSTLGEQMGFIDDKSLYSGSMTFYSEVYVMKILNSVVFLLYS